MGVRLPDYEWQFLLQMITRIFCCDSYETICRTTMQQLKTLIPFEEGVCFHTRRRDGKAELYDPVGWRSEDGYEFFLNNSYPRWSEFIMAPSSTAFRQSDLVQGERWENSRVYREIWKPRNIYWGLFLSVVYQDEPQVLLGLFRSADQKDFSERDLFIIGLLHDALEQRLSRLAHQKGDGYGLKKLPLTAAAEYGLTRRESEITDLICNGYSSERLCEVLYISPSTLNKHLSNIYNKTGVKNRLQLANLMLK